MKWTNKYNIEQGFCTAIKHYVERDHHSKDPNTISATEVCDSYMQRALKLQYWNYVTADYSDYMWMLLGSSVHYILSLHKEEGALHEMNQIVELGNGGILSCTPDRVVPSKFELYDYKVTSVYSFLKELHKKSWEKQLNVYAYALARNGITIKRAVINALLRDHSKVKAVTGQGGPNYPQIPFTSKEIRLWGIDKQGEFLRERLTNHFKYQNLNVNDVPVCTHEPDGGERWYKVDKYAIMMTGAKRAHKLFATKDQAEEYAIEKKFDADTYWIETRGEESMRCRYYCSLTQFCPWFKELYPDEDAVELEVK